MCVTQQKIASFKSELKEKDQALLDAREESNESYDRMLSDLTNSASEVDALKADVEAKSRQITFQKEQMAALAEKLKQQPAAVDPAESEECLVLRAQLEEAKEVAMQATELATTTKEQMDSQMQSLMEDHEQTLLAHIQQVQAAREEGSRGLEEAKAQATELQQQLEQQSAEHRASVEHLHADHEEALAAAKAQFNRTNVEAANESSNELQELHQTNLELQMEVEHQQSVLTNLNEEKNTLVQEATKLSEQVEGLKTQQQERQDEAQQKFDDLKTQAQQQIHASQERLGELQQKLEKTRASAIAEITQTTDKLQHAENLLEEEANRVQELTQQLSVAQNGTARVSELEQQLAEVTDALSQHEQNAASREANADKKAQHQFVQMKNEADKAQRQLAQVKNEAQNIINRLQSRTQELEGLLDAKTHEVRAREDNLQLLSTELAQAHATGRQRELAIDEGVVAVKQKLKEAERALEQRDVEYESAQRRINKLEKSKLTTAWVQRMQDMNKAKKRLSVANKRLKAELKVLKNSQQSTNVSGDNQQSNGAAVAKYAKEVKHLRAMVSEYEKKLKQHAEYVHRLEANEATLKKLLEEAKTKEETPAAPASEDTAALEEELRESHYKMEKLTRKLSKRKLQVTTMVGELKGMKDKVQAVEAEKQVGCVRVWVWVHTRFLQNK